jgi:hypothetical protein
MKRKLLFQALAVPVLAIIATGTQAATSGECREYAGRAVQDYKTTIKVEKCAPGATGARWQANYDNHYQWCLAAPGSWLRSEAQARNDYKVKCGAVGGID